MILFSYYVSYLMIGVFFVMVGIRIAMWLKLPIHVRWELYPVPHEAPHRAAYGGSYFEESDWWKKPRERSLVGEIKAMATEIGFLEALREHNRRLWIASYPFHLGLYIIIAVTLILFGGALLEMVLPSLGTPAFIQVLTRGASILAFAGVGLTLVGTIGLLYRRLTSSDLRDFTTPADFFNLLFFLVAFGLTLVHMIWLDPHFDRTYFFIAHLVRFSPMPLPIDAGGGVILTGSTTILLAVLLAYIPMTHMSHFIGKYFAYHAIRWNDTPNLRGGNEESRIHEVLHYPITWSAKHIQTPPQPNASKTWAEVATQPMPEEKK